MAINVKKGAKAPKFVNRVVLTSLFYRLFFYCSSIVLLSFFYHA